MPVYLPKPWDSTPGFEKKVEITFIILGNSPHCKEEDINGKISAKCIHLSLQKRDVKAIQ